VGSGVEQFATMVVRDVAHIHALPIDRHLLDVWGVSSGRLPFDDDGGRKDTGFVKAIVIYRWSRACSKSGILLTV
jgi:hypothetical protein